MTSQIQRIEAIMQNIPIAWVLVGADDILLGLNKSAESVFGLVVGQDIGRIIHEESKLHWQRLRSGASGEIQLRFEAGQMTYGAVTRDTDSHHETGIEALFIRDVTEAVKLKRQLKTALDPERKFIHELSNALTTTLGYSELMTLNMEDQTMLSYEQLTTISHYHNEVFSGLKRADNLIRARKQSRREHETNGLQQALVVGSDASHVKELSDILNQLNCRTVVFDELQDALSCIAQSERGFDFVVMEHTTSIDTDRMTALIKNLTRSTPLVMFVGDGNFELNASTAPALHLVRKPIARQEVTQIFSALLA